MKIGFSELALGPIFHRPHILWWSESVFKKARNCYSGPEPYTNCIFPSSLTLSWIKKLLPLLLSCFSRVRLCATPWTAAHQAPPSMEFSRQEYWSGLRFPLPGDLPNPGIEPGSFALEADAFTIWGTREVDFYQIEYQISYCILTKNDILTGLVICEIIF